MSAIHPNVKPRDGGTPDDGTTPAVGVPISYDEITRRTVPLPDSSHRPTDGEVYDAENPVLREPTELEAVIAAAIRAHLAEDQHLDGSDLGVTVTGTTASLTGSVVTEADRRRAIEITQEVPGVTAVVDELRVRLD
jgi:hypothetical protein